MAVDAVGEVVAVDDEVDVTVADIDLGARRIGLSTVERATEAPPGGSGATPKGAPGDAGRHGPLRHARRPAAQARPARLTATALT
jgi:transcriptional accessory protein Tex/SPT6